MSKIKKIFSKKLPEHIARFIHHKTGNYISKLSEKKLLLKEKDWNDKFLTDPYFILDIDNGIKITLYKESILSRLIYDGFEQDEIEIMKRVLKPGDVFIDIGANIGLFSLIGSTIVGIKGKVICFEPTKKTYKRLLENIELNALVNIDAKNIGLSNQPGVLSMNQSENGHDAWNTFALQKDDKFQNVVETAVSTLDIELENIDKHKISFIKIDVEGWEKFVIEGGHDILTKYAPTILIEFTESNTFSAGYSVHELYDMMESLGYVWYRYINGNLIKEKKQLHYPYDNLIATKDEAKLKNTMMIN